jgi:hypothetical protein
MKQTGGNNFGKATNDLLVAMKNLGKSIFVEINAITNISNDINNGTNPSQTIPNSMKGPPPFKPPKL